MTRASPDPHRKLVNATTINCYLDVRTMPTSITRAYETALPALDDLLARIEAT